MLVGLNLKNDFEILTPQWPIFFFSRFRLRLGTIRIQKICRSDFSSSASAESGNCHGKRRFCAAESALKLVDLSRTRQRPLNCTCTVRYYRVGPPFQHAKQGSQYMLLIFEASFILKSKFTQFFSCRPAVLNFTILPSRYSAGTHFTQFATELLRTGTFSKLAYLTGSSYLRYINNPSTSYFAYKKRGPTLLW